MTESINNMVLRCEKTGALFYNSKDAEAHAEATGFSDFAQVSLEEKVWICVETGKVCYTEHQVDQHRRRVPEAKTFEEKTIADVRAKQLEKQQAASSSGGGDMETEEDMILRAAGKKPKGKAAAAEPAGPPVVTKELVDQLVEMGFSELRAQRALLKTSNAGVEPAVNWLGEHLEDADIDEPLPEGSFEVKTQEQLSEEAAKAAAGSQLTEEEKKAKLDELLAKARAKKAEKSVQDERESELSRRENVKAVAQAKKDLEDQQRKQAIEARMREKREAELERKRLLEQLEADRADKIARGLLVETKPTPKPAEPEPAPAPAPKPAADPEHAPAKRGYDEDPLTVEEATKKLAELHSTKSNHALEMMTKMMANIAKSPADPKFRKVRLSNPKIREGLVLVPGARQFLRAIGWQLVETEFLELPLEGDGVAQAAAQTKAVEKLVRDIHEAHEAARLAELEARKKAAAEKAAADKKAREEIRAQMERDRAEVAARGPAQASVAHHPPSGPGGTMTSAIFQDSRQDQGGS